MVDINLGNIKGADGEKGNGIVSIVKTGTSGLVDTYTVTYDDGNTDTIEVTNGEDAHIQDFYADSTNNTITLEYGEGSDLIDLVYPVGSIYMSVNDTSPSILFGGTWEQLEDKFLLGAGTTYDAGDTGGSKDAVVVSHNHTQNSHNHTQNSHSHDASNSRYFITSDKSLQTGSTKRVAPANTSGNHYVQSPDGEPTIERTSNTKTATATNQSTIATNQSTGVSGTDKNMPPYLVVYMWQRTE